MNKYSFCYSICLAFFLMMNLNACNSQVNTGSLNNEAHTLKPVPEIIGTPPTFVAPPASISDSLVSQYIRCIFQDSKGNFWFGPAGQSVVRYDEKTLNYFSKNEFFNGLAHAENDFNSVHAIAEDKQGNIWFGTSIGVVKYDGKTFTGYNEKNGLSNIKVGRDCILVAKSGTIWIGTEGGIFQYHPTADSAGGKCFMAFNLLPAIVVKDIMEDNSGNIWFASQDNGVYRYDINLQNGEGKAIKNISVLAGLGNNYAGGMAQDKAGNFWFTMNEGICRYDPVLEKEVGLSKAFTTITAEDGLGGSEIWGIYIETSGIIWITARGSNTRYDPSIPISNANAFTVFTEADGINCCVQSMYQDRSGNMWWGTGAGLYRFDGNRFYQVKQKGPW